MYLPGYLLTVLLLLLLVSGLLYRLPLLISRFPGPSTRRSRADHQALLLLLLALLAGGLHGLFSAFSETVSAPSLSPASGPMPGQTLRLVAAVVGLLLLQAQARVLIGAYRLRRRHPELASLYQPAGPLEILRFLIPTAVMAAIVYATWQR